MHINEIITLSLEISDLRKTLKAKERALKKAVSSSGKPSSKKGKNPPAEKFASQIDTLVAVAQRSDSESRRETYIDRCLSFLESRADWCHRSVIAQHLDQAMDRTSVILSLLKKEGQVHNDGRGHWRYGRGGRSFDKVPRG